MALSLDDIDFGDSPKLTLDDVEFEEPAKLTLDDVDFGEEKPSDSLFDFGGAMPSFGGLLSVVGKSLRPFSWTDEIAQGYEALDEHRATGAPVEDLLEPRWSDEERASFYGLGVPLAASAMTMPLAASLAGTGGSVAGALGLSGAVGAGSRAAMSAASGGSAEDIKDAVLNPTGLVADTAFGLLGHYGPLRQAMWKRLPKAGQDLLKRRVAEPFERHVAEPTGRAWRGTMAAGNRGFDKLAAAAARRGLIDVGDKPAIAAGAKLHLTTDDIMPQFADGADDALSAGEELLEIRELIRRTKEIEEEIAARGAEGLPSEELVKDLREIKKKAYDLRARDLPEAGREARHMTEGQTGAALVRKVKEAAGPLLWTPERRLLKSTDPAKRAIGVRIQIGRAVEDRVRALGRQRAAGVLDEFDPADLQPRLSPDDLIDGQVPEELAQLGIEKADQLPRAYRAIQGEEGVRLSGDGEAAVASYRQFVDDLFKIKEDLGVRTSLSPDSITNLVNRGKAVYNLDPDESVELAKLLQAAGNPGTFDDVAQARFKELVEKADGHVVWKAADRKAGTAAYPVGVSVPIQKLTNYVPAIVRGDRKIHGHEQEIEYLRTHPLASLGEAEEAVARNSQRDMTEFVRQYGDDDHLETSLEELMARMVESDARLVANVAAWGGKTTVAKLDTFENEVGELARRSLDYLVDTGEAGAAESLMLRKYLQQRYTRDVAPDAGAMHAIANLTSRAALTRSFATSWGEIGKGIWAAGGIGGWVRGREIIRRNPELGRMFEDTGAQSAQIADLINRVVGDTMQEMGKDASYLMPMDMMARTERWLRGPVSHGAVATIHDVAKRAAKAIEPGERTSAALMKEAAEIFPQLTGEEAVRKLGRAWVETGGTLPKEIWADGTYNLVRRWFYSTAAGSIPAALGTPVGMVAGQYRPFMLRATQHFYDDILQPLASGDASLMALGAKRFARMMVYSAPPNAAAVVAKAAMRGRLPHPASFATQYFGSNLGLAGDVMNVGVAQATGNPGSIGDVTQIPVLSVSQQALQKVTRLNAADALEAAGDFGAMRYDPRLGHLDFIGGLLRATED